MAEHSPQGWRRQVLLALVAGLAIVALVESYGALRSAAVEGDRPHPWLWPAAVDGFTLAMSLSVWQARSEGRRAPWAWLLLLAATAVSTALQVLDAPRSPIGLLTSAWTPLALLLAFERLMWLLHAPAVLDVETVTDRSETLPAVGADEENTLVSDTAEGVQVAGRVRGDHVERLLVTARAKADLERAGKRVTGRAIAERVGCSEGTARRLLRLLTECEQALPHSGPGVAIEGGAS